jgi:hypothetical protein
MFRFTIRDVLWLTVVVGMGVGWWVDHRRLDSENGKWRGEVFKLGFRLIPLESFTQGTERIAEISKASKESPPSPEAAAEILRYVLYDQDWRIRVRAMAVVPNLKERTEAITVLLHVLHERDVEKCGEGVLPLYAAKYLAEMNAPNAAEEIKSWLESLRTSSPYDQEMTTIMIDGAERDLKKLVAAESNLQGQGNPARGEN